MLAGPLPPFLCRYNLLDSILYSLFHNRLWNRSSFPTFPIPPTGRTFGFVAKHGERLPPILFPLRAKRARSHPYELHILVFTSQLTIRGFFTADSSDHFIPRTFFHCPSPPRSPCSQKEESSPIDLNVGNDSHPVLMSPLSVEQGPSRKDSFPAPFPFSPHDPEEDRSRVRLGNGGTLNSPTPPFWSMHAMHSTMPAKHGRTWNVV